MNCKFILFFLLVLMVVCSQILVLVGIGGDDVVLVVVKVVDQQMLVYLDVQCLQSQYWLLQQVIGVDGKCIDVLFVCEGKLVILDFVDGCLLVSNICNCMGGGYILVYGKLMVSVMVLIMMVCIDKVLMVLDEVVLSCLQGELKVEQDVDGKLILINVKGDVLVFNLELIVEICYGGVGEIVFLEVVVKIEKCLYLLILDYQCLQVCEVKFDDKGLKQGELGKFENFYGNIEGYIYEDGVCNVVCVKCYEVKNLLVDVLLQVYVLDMVVELVIEK